MKMVYKWPTSLNRYLAFQYSGSKRAVPNLFIACRTHNTNGESIQFKIHLRLFDIYRLRFANLRLKSST